MKKSAFIAGLSALFLTGCVLLGPDETVKIGDRTFTLKGSEGFNADLKKLPSPELVFVFVTPGGKIVVDQEPVRPTRSDGPIMILWVLAAKTSINFPDKNAIVLGDLDRKSPLPSGLACDVLGSAKKYFACIYDKPNGPRQWKYSIRLKDGNTDLEYLDPWIHQP